MEIAFSILGTCVSVASVLIALSTFVREGRKNGERMMLEYQNHQGITDTKIDNLAEQVEKHNNVVERMFVVEADVANLFHRYAEVKGIADEAARRAAHAEERAEASHNRLDRSKVDAV